MGRRGELLAGQRQREQRDAKAARYRHADTGDAKPVPCGRLHDPPPLHVRNSTRAKLLQPTNLCFLVVGFDINVNSARVIDCVYSHLDFLRRRVELSVIRITRVR